MDNKFGLYINTIRYLNARQIVYRAFYSIRKRIGYIPAKVKFISDIRYLPINYKNSIYKFESQKANIVIDKAEEILRNHFETIADNVIRFDNGIDWDMDGNDYRLLCFRLNSFRFLLTLSDAYKVTKDKKYIDYGFYLIDNWNAQCSDKISGDKWNPYVIAERLQNWIGFCSSYCKEGDISFYAGRIRQNAIQLKKTIEYQIDGNHLLSEGKAMLFAGAFLKDKKLYENGKQLLSKEFYRQFLPDGGHYERSISYHVEALQQYFEAAMLMFEIGDEDALVFRSMLIKPYIFLNSMIGADGHIPLVNDAAYDYPFDARDFLNTARALYGVDAPKAVEGNYSRRWKNVNNSFISIDWSSGSFYADTGFLMEHYRIDGTSYSLFFDAGDIGADVNPGHAHADSLNILLSKEGKAIFVDSGVFTYKPGIERNLCRGTSAHNTIEIDGKDSAEVWAAFRVAKRGRTKVKRYSNTSNKMDIIASHDGYCRVLGHSHPVLHTRRVSLDKSNGKIHVDDQLVGKGKHTAILRFYLSPDCKVELTGDKTALIDEKYIFECSYNISLEDCQIAEYFGKPRDSKYIKAVFQMDGKERITSVFRISGKRGQSEPW